ncbi:glycosyltransferase [Bacillus anthracis]|uniref:glycosyltransferase n=1 Tax=Bacillus TaxID=1386 RepID=UPI00077A3E0B|nr:MULTISPECIES: glycosyltransferase [Bacillus cereus group]OTY59876.1 glycosyltransferase [Bacillus thuringiensis serovar graciosensis]PFC81243.1 glycosyltransferase [Bacillus anthracis]PFT23228.1 glycosyltransferase [Bacillus thuringiensis]KXY87132.1 glycosyltransferase [Bacillus cereus]MBG9837778.1 capsular biosynthesis protein [Bacillus tropicus]
MYSLNIGGVERSLIGLLETLNYKKYDIDLFLYRQEGDFINFIPKEVNLLPVIKQYTTFERPIKNIIKEGHMYLGAMRILAKLKAKVKNKGQNIELGTYKQMQYTWRYSLPVLPKLKKKYDIAIGFLGPHDFILEKVNADIKIGWNHTDYFTIVNPDKSLDGKMWGKLNYIINVSKECQESFLKVFPTLKQKTIVIENILSPNFVINQSKKSVENEMDGAEVVKICSVGRLSNAKGFDQAVLACKKLVELGYDVKWYVVGYGGEETYIKQLIKENEMAERFVLLGKKINPYPYISSCDIYCQPSRYEGKAVTVREAQILGKAVVITNFPTAKGQLSHGFDGWITPMGVEGIVEGIKTLIEDTELKTRLISNTMQVDYGNSSEIEKLYEIFNQQNK